MPEIISCFHGRIQRQFFGDDQLEFRVGRLKRVVPGAGFFIDGIQVPRDIQGEADKARIGTVDRKRLLPAFGQAVGQVLYRGIQLVHLLLPVRDLFRDPGIIIALEINPERSVEIVIELAGRILCILIGRVAALLVDAVVPDLRHVIEQAAAKLFHAFRIETILVQTVDAVIVLKIRVDLRDDLAHIAVLRNLSELLLRGGIFLCLIQRAGFLVDPLTADIVQVFFRVGIAADLAEEFLRTVVVTLLERGDSVLVDPLVRDLFEVSFRVAVVSQFLEHGLRDVIITLFKEADGLLIILLRYDDLLIINKIAGSDHCGAQQRDQADLRRRHALFDRIPAMRAGFHLV